MGKLILKGENLRKSFGGLIAVDNVNFVINKGDIFGLIGPNGAGKTTLFNLITNILPKDSGRVSFNEHDITGMRTYEITWLGCSRTYQGNKIFSNLTVFENVWHARHSVTKSGIYDALLRTKTFVNELEVDRNEIEKILEFLGLGGEKSKIASELSYGNQGKLGVALALATNPQLVLLDEPLAGMNPKEIMEMIEILKKIREMGITIFLIEHNIKAAMKLCNTLMVLDHGKKIAEGPPFEISKNHEVIKAYLGQEYNVSG